MGEADRQDAAADLPSPVLLPGTCPLESLPPPEPAHHSRWHSGPGWVLLPQTRCAWPHYQEADQAGEPHLRGPESSAASPVAAGAWATTLQLLRPDLVAVVCQPWVAVSLAWASMPVER